MVGLGCNNFGGRSDLDGVLAVQVAGPFALGDDAVLLQLGQLGGPDAGHGAQLVAVDEHPR